MANDHTPELLEYVDRVGQRRGDPVRGPAPPHESGAKATTGSCGTDLREAEPDPDESSAEAWRRFVRSGS